MEQKLNDFLQKKFQKTIESASNEEIYLALLGITKEAVEKKGVNQGKKKVYYISAEFLIGKLLSNNLINLGLFDEVQEILERHGKKIEEIEEIEPEPSLGNGGLGRLAACFLDSIATLGLNGDGIGLNYHFGLFRQIFEENKQKEIPNPWIEEQGWLEDTGKSYEVCFGKDKKVTSRMFDLTITGYDNGCTKLHLFDTDSIDESIVKDGIDFDKEMIEKNLTLFLYPDDSDEAGNLLRIYQQYFMVSSGAQFILEECEEKGYDLRKLHEHVAIQINDTHPSMVIPELIRLLVEKGLDEDEAVEIVSKTCAYTNHTILAEALEKWPLEYLEKVVPQLVPIIQDLDQKVKKIYENPDVAIIDEEERVHMARMDMHYGYSVNGVAALHTDILKSEELKDFYEIYPEKFNNKTNGITFRRWLLHCNRELTGYLEELIGPGFKKDAKQLEKLMKYQKDPKVLEKLHSIKMQKKLQLKEYLKETQGIVLDENSIFCIQSKRLHEYKRQQMNALYIIYKYLEIKKGNLPKRPITIIFGAKAAPAYTIAKDIIHLILCLSKLINDDPSVSPYLKVVMIENYNVTKAEKIIPACDISEQISLASKEASGTGNMKYMLNGAVTLGTMDGANVEIHDFVGDENIYVFGKSSEEVMELYKNEGYVSEDFYIEDEQIKELVDFIVGDQLWKMGSRKNLLRLYKELLNKDWFMTLLDIKDYIRVKEKAFMDYEDRKAWAEKMIVNIAKAGFFSSDRTIAQYNEDIWKL